MPTKRHDQMSVMSANIIKGALARLNQYPVAKTADDVDPKSGRMLLEKAAKLYPGMHDIGFGLVRISADDESLPAIWKKEMMIDPKTGVKAEWIVAYTTDDDDIMRDVASSLKVVSDEKESQSEKKDEKEDEKEEESDKVKKSYMQYCPKCETKMTQGKCPKCNKGEVEEKKEEKEAAIRSQAAEPGAPPAPKKNAVPIAPGVLNKNLNLDQSGQGGTAKVTVEFNDLAKGQQFFESVEENAGGAGKEPAAPGAPEEKKEAPEEEAPAEEGAEPKGPGGPGAPPVPTPAGGPGAGGPQPPMASTIHTMTVYGQQAATIMAQKFANYPTKYYYINEQGLRVDLPFVPKLGTKFQRPDQPGTMIRVYHIVAEAGKSDDDDIIKALAVDVSDQVPPMNWTNKESQNESGEGSNQGGPQPPNPELQPGQPPTADTSKPQPVYDSNAPGGGVKPKYNISVDPGDGSVTVKMDKSQAVDAIDQAVQGQQPPMQPPGQQPPAAPGAGPAAPGAPMGGQPKSDFNQTESPVTF